MPILRRRPATWLLPVALALVLTACGRSTPPGAGPGLPQPATPLNLQAGPPPAAPGFQLGALVQTPRKIALGETGQLALSVSNPGNGPLAFRWSALRGRLSGTGAHVTYQPDARRQGPNQLDDVVTVQVTDRQGLSRTQSYPVDTFIGTATWIQAKQATTWVPSRTAYASFFGNVTITATGAFSVYDAVIVEYGTPRGRQTALLRPGPTTLSGVSGYLFCYLLGPGGPHAPQPNIQLAMRAGGQVAWRTLTQAQVLPSQHAGTPFLTAPGEGDNVVDVSDARNGPFPYTRLLLIRSEGLMAQPGGENAGHIRYSLLKTGDRFFGFDPRLADGDSDMRVTLTDSLGGLSDNGGAWRVDHLQFD